MKSRTLEKVLLRVWERYGKGQGRGEPSSHSMKINLLTNVDEPQCNVVILISLCPSTRTTSISFYCQIIVIIKHIERKFPLHWMFNEELPSPLSPGSAVRSIIFPDSHRKWKMSKRKLISSLVHVVGGFYMQIVWFGEAIKKEFRRIPFCGMIGWGENVNREILFRNLTLLCFFLRSKWLFKNTWLNLWTDP